jgi:hypothetical protein
MKRRLRPAAAVGLIVLALVLVLAACAAGPNASVGTPTVGGQVAGFWPGLWHGIISPVTFIISLFNKDVNLYEVHNDGNWYNFGFVLGAGILFGGGFLGMGRSGNRNR